MQKIHFTMRKILFLLLLAFGAHYASAKGYNCLKVNLSNGSTVTIVLSDDLQVSFTDDNLVAKGSLADVQIAKNDIDTFEHVYDASSSISDATIGGTTMNQQGNSLNFSNLPVNTTLRVFDTGGREVMSENASSDFEFSLDGLTPGIYIVVVNNQSYKVVIR